MHSISTPSLHIDNPDPLHWLGYICRNSKTGRGIQTPILPPCKHKIDPALNMHVQGKSSMLLPPGDCLNAKKMLPKNFGLMVINFSDLNSMTINRYKSPELDPGVSSLDSSQFAICLYQCIVLQLTILGQSRCR